MTEIASVYELSALTTVFCIFGVRKGAGEIAKDGLCCIVRGVGIVRAHHRMGFRLFL